MTELIDEVSVRGGKGRSAWIHSPLLLYGVQSYYTALNVPVTSHRVHIACDAPAVSGAVNTYSAARATSAAGLKFIRKDTTLWCLLAN
jgi:hypothetical protein